MLGAQRLIEAHHLQSIDVLPLSAPKSLTSNEKRVRYTHISEEINI